MILAKLAPPVSEISSRLDPTQATKGSAATQFLPTTLMTNIISIAGLVIGVGAVLSLVYGGVLYITAGADENKSATGKRVIIYSVIAIVIVLLSYVIYNSILGGIAKGPEGI